MQHPIPSARWPTAVLTTVPLVVLAFGHTLSNLLRTLPAMATDVMSLDMGTTTALLGLLTGAYHLFFALTALGCVAAALARGPVGFFVAQALLGIGCCGMLLSATPMAWLIERHGWRASFWVATTMALGIGALVALVVPRSDRAAAPPARRLGTELREMLTITASPSLPARWCWPSPRWPRCSPCAASGAGPGSWMSRACRASMRATR